MNLAILGKIGLGALFSGSSAILTIAINKPEWFGFYSSVYIYALSVKVSDAEQTEIKHDSENKNYKCQFTGDTKQFDCTVHAWNVDAKNTKSQYKLNAIANSEKSTSSATNLAQENKSFMVVIHGKEWEKNIVHNSPNKEKNIEIVSSTGTNKKKYGNLTQVAGFYKGANLVKSNYFIGQATKNLTTVAACVCSFDSKSNSTNENCKIYEFSSEETTGEENKKYGEFKFTKSNTTATEIKKHKHYLIQFTESDKKHDINDFDKKIIYANKTSSSTDKIDFINVKIAAYDGHSNHIFVV